MGDKGVLEAIAKKSLTFLRLDEINLSLIRAGPTHVAKFSSNRFGLHLKSGDHVGICIRDVSFFTDVTFEIE